MNEMTSDPSPTQSDTPTTLLIRGRSIPVNYEEIAHDRLRFYEANPRVYSLVRRNDKVPTQADIQQQLLEMDHVKELVQDIKRNGGLMEPVLVKRGSFEVLEGNSRLAAYRALASKEPLKWAKMRCMMLPEAFPENLTFALLAQLHVRGKKDWAPFEQAGFFYRRFHDQSVDVAALANEAGLSQKRVKQLIDTYDFMIKAGEDDISHWSHYEELLKSRVIQKTRVTFPTFDDTVVSLIRTDSSFKAVDVRDRLPTICSGPLKTVRRFAEGKLSFEDAFESAVDAGADNNALRRLNKFRQWLADSATARVVLSAAGDQDRAKVAFELEKIRSRVVSLQGMLDRAKKV